MAQYHKITRNTKLEDLPEFLTVEELCAFLAIGKTCGYEMVRRGEIETRRFGRLIRIPRSVLTEGAGNGRQ